VVPKWSVANVMADKELMWMLLLALVVVYLIGLLTGLGAGYLAGRWGRRTTPTPGTEPEAEPPAPLAPPLPPCGEVGIQAATSLPPPPLAPAPTSRPRTRVVREIFWAASGAADLKFHLDRNCAGLHGARRISGHRGCLTCVGAEFKQQL